jgi:Transposase DDE domain group 1
LADLGGLRDQQSLFGPVASDATAFRVIERIAFDPGLIDAVREAHAVAREYAWRLGMKPGEATMDMDATLLVAHSEKHGADGNYKGGYGFHPMLAYMDQTGEALAVRLRPGSSGSNDAADQIVVGAAALGLRRRRTAFRPKPKAATLHRDASKTSTRVESGGAALVVRRLRGVARTLRPPRQR